MKKVLKVIGVIALAAVVGAGGYIAGTRAQHSSIVSALPRAAIDRPTGTPEEEAARPDAKNGEDTPPPAMTAAKNIIEKNSQSGVQPDWTLVNKAPVTIGGNTATVFLYTSAEKDEDGNYIWDDSNSWVLEVESKNEYYTLLNKRVQLGSVNFLSGDNESGESVITVIVNTTTGLTVEKYTYNGNSFEGETVYNSGVLNVRGSSF